VKRDVGTVAGLLGCNTDEVQAVDVGKQERWSGTSPILTD
jgi:hypothetical protein